MASDLIHFLILYDTNWSRTLSAKSLDEPNSVHSYDRWALNGRHYFFQVHLGIGKWSEIGFSGWWAGNGRTEDTVLEDYVALWLVWWCTLMKKIGIPFAGYPRVYIWQSIHWCRIFLGCLNTLYFCFFDVFAWTYLMFYRFLVGLFETLFFVLSSQLPNNNSNNNNGGD